MSYFKTSGKKTNFTPEEDDRLMQIIIDWGNEKIDWEVISSHFPNKTLKQCFNRYTVLLRKGKRENINEKNKFSPGEDKKIVELFKKYGDGYWNLISSCLYRKTAKQCKERYENYLNPNINKKVWTQEEDKLLMEKAKTLNLEWVKISPFFKEKTINQLKNRYELLSKQKKEAQPQNDMLNYFDVFCDVGYNQSSASTPTKQLNDNIQLKEISNNIGGATDEMIFSPNEYVDYDLSYFDF